MCWVSSSSFHGRRSNDGFASWQRKVRIHPKSIFTIPWADQIQMLVKTPKNGLVTNLSVYVMSVCPPDMWFACQSEVSILFFLFTYASFVYSTDVSLHAWPSVLMSVCLPTWCDESRTGLPGRFMVCEIKKNGEKNLSTWCLKFVCLSLSVCLCNVSVSIHLISCLP